MREIATVPSRLTSTPRRSAIAATILVVGLLAVLAIALYSGVRWVTHGVQSVLDPTPSSSAYGQCKSDGVYGCDEIPLATIESVFGAQIPPHSKMLVRDGNPQPAFSGHAIVETVFELPRGASASDWLSIVGLGADPPALADPDVAAPELYTRGVRNIKGGTADDGRWGVYTGTKDGHVYVSAWARLS